MRVISGYLKGRKLEGYDISGTRPTMDRVKESLFAMIQDYLSDSVCLDLFSGSGNLGIEAISQGAKFCYFVDHQKTSIRCIYKNITALQIEKHASILEYHYIKALKMLKNKKMNIIFLDPPYQTDYIEKCLILISQYDLLADGGIVICESDHMDKIIYHGDYEVLKSREYKDKVIVILKKI